MTTNISNDARLKLLGLFKLATEYYSKCREAELAISRELIRLGSSEEEGFQGYICDAIYAEKSSVQDFDSALGRDGFVIENEKQP